MRWYYSALVRKTHMHDRHSGPPVSWPPVYGDDTDSDACSASEGEEEEEEGPRGGKRLLRVLTWNTAHRPQLQHVVEAAKAADAVCLQEVTAPSAAWLQEQLGEEFLVITPWTCAAAFSSEAIGVAVLLRKKVFQLQERRLHRLASEMDRTLLTVRVKVRGSSLSLLLGTLHLESGRENAGARAVQVGEVCEVMGRVDADGAVLAGDFNFAEGEDAAEALGKDAWTLAGECPSKRWTWRWGGMRWGPSASIASSYSLVRGLGMPRL